MAASNANKISLKRFKWSLDFASRPRNDREVSSPPGYSTSASLSQIDISKENDNHLLIKKSWEIALAPLKQVPMNLFIMYMAGNSISIFPIMMVGMLLMRPVKSLVSLQNTFESIEGKSVIGQKFVFLLGNLANLGLALYKCQSMGLLPTHSSDWLAFLEPPQQLEFSGGGASLS